MTADRETEGLRERILRAARALLLEDGIQAVTMRKVANAIGYTATSIYYHFENKDQLIFALIDEGFELLYQSLSRIQDGLPRETDPLSRIEANMRGFVAFAEENPEFYEIMYMIHSEELTRYPKESYRRTRRNLDLGADLYERARRAGCVRDVDPGLMTSTLACALHGYVSMRLRHRIDARYDSDVLFESLIATQLEGIRADRRGPAPADRSRIAGPS